MQNTHHRLSQAARAKTEKKMTEMQSDGTIDKEEVAIRESSNCSKDLECLCCFAII
jgi:hypothetical protein